MRVRRILVTSVVAVLSLPLLFIPELRAGGGPENVIVVVNGDSWASLTVANEFIHLRRIPACNVVYLDDLPSVERIDVDLFRQSALAPVLEAIERRKLTNQIDYIVYSPDIPYAIDVRRDIGERKLPRHFTPVASITGLTYLYRSVLAKDPGYLRLDINRYMRRRLALLAARPLSEDERKQYYEAVKLAIDKKWSEAAQIFSGLVPDHPRLAHLHYNLACCLAQQNKPDEAMAALRRAVENGWMNYRHTKSDKDLASLRDRKDFRGLLEKMEKRTFDVQPTHGFRSTYEWGEQGEIVSSKGQRYMLSTVLAVTSGRGNSVREALESLRRSAAADGTRPPGTIYYMVNDNVRSTTRDWAFACAVAKLKELGVRAQIIPGKLPEGKPDVQGAVVGTASFDWWASRSTILPGAICEHLTSAGGVLREGAKQTPLTEFIRYGAAGASGTVMEPYAIEAKFPTALVHVHYAQGCTLAESFYQSVHGPYQLLIVGDPLCRPWAHIPEVGLDGLEPGATIKGTMALLAEVKGDIDHYELFVDGRRVGTCQPPKAFELDTAEFADGYHELRVVAVSADPTETQGRLVLPVEIANRDHRLEVTAPEDANIVWDRPLRLAARLPDAREIAFFHNLRQVGTIHGEEGQIDIDPRRLGQGPVAIQAVAIMDDKSNTHVMGLPIHLHIVPPPALPPMKLDSATPFVNGLRLTCEGGSQVVVEDTRDRIWLKKAGVKPGRSFELVGYFDVPAEDVYQFQVNTNCQVMVEVDSATPAHRAGEGWTFLPVALGAGVHKLRVSGSAQNNPWLDIRFGGPGAYHLSGSRFRHLAEVPDD